MKLIFNSRCGVLIWVIPVFFWLIGGHAHAAMHGSNTENFFQQQSETFDKNKSLFIWAGPAGGSWHEPTHWTPNGVPGAGDEVTISAESVVISTPVIAGWRKQ